MVLGVAAVSFAQTATQPTSLPSRTTGKWLVDLGRDYPLSPQASVSDADAELTLAFMQAAGRVEPTLAEAWLWQHNMLWALRREAEAAEALREYVRLQPDDWSAHVTWIELRTDSLQTLEERVAFWQEKLKESDLPAEVASDLHRRLAEYYYNRGESVPAMTHVRESLAAFPENLAARRLSVELSKDRVDPAPRLALALDLVRCSPSQPVLAWDVATLLDSQSMHADAQRWYAHARAMFRQLDPDGELPADFVLQMAASQVAGGQFDSAAKLAEQVLAADRANTSARRLLACIARLQNRPAEAERQILLIRQAFETAWTKRNGSADPDLAAEMAWFYCVEDPNIPRAYELAAAAMNVLSPSDLARRAFGYACVRKWELENAKEAGAATGPATRPTTLPGLRPTLLDEARRVLRSVADSDPWAAVALAAAQRDSGDVESAVALLTNVAARHRSGLLFQEVSARLAELGAPVPPPASNEHLRKLLAGFDERVLSFGADAKQYVQFAISPLGADYGAVDGGNPLWCRFELANRGPFGITLGEQLMLNPSALVVLRSVGDRERGFGGMLTVALNRRQLLAPGKSIAMSQTLDIGPLRAALIGTPQVVQVVEVMAVPSPVYSAERQEWVSRPLGLEVGPIRIERRAMRPDDPGDLGLKATLDIARGASTPQRVAAMERLMMWLAEHQHLRAGRLRYPAQPVDPAVLIAAVQERFADPAWEVRAHLAESLRWVELERELAQAASGLLSDPHWLVRMLAIRMFADHHGAKFDKVAAYYAEHDPDDLVCTVARAVRHRWVSTTQPASSAPTRR